MAKRYELTDAQWRRICDLLPGKVSDPGRTGADNRQFVNGVLWVLRSGARWHDLPERYGKWKTVHKRNPTRKRLIPYNFTLYKLRNRIERCFNRLKHFRRIATRYDRRANYFLAFI